MIARKPADERKAEIVTAMLRLADEVGPDRLTTQAVASAVGLTQPAIFRHFATKRDLWLAAAATISGRLKAAWGGALKSSDDPAERIAALIIAQLGQIEALPAIPSILFSRELQAENDDLRLSVHALMTELLALLSAEITTAQTSGKFHRNILAADAALLLISLVQGLAIRWSLGQRGFSIVTEGRRLLEVQMRLFLAAPPEASI